MHLALSWAHAQLQALDCGCVARDCSASSWISLRSPRAPGATQSTLSPRGQRYEQRKAEKRRVKEKKKQEDERFRERFKSVKALRSVQESALQFWDNVRPPSRRLD